MDKMASWRCAGTVNCYLVFGLVRLYHTSSTISHRKKRSSLVIQHFLARGGPIFFVIRHAVHHDAAPLRGSRCKASATARGLRAVNAGASAGPSGVRRPCSQLRRVATLTPIMRANSVCDALSFSRTDFTSAGRKVVTRAGFMMPRRIFPACRMLVSSSWNDLSFMWTPPGRAWSAP